MTKKIDSLMKEVLERINPSQEEIQNMKSSLSEFEEKVNSSIRKNKIDARLFVGGSYAKETLIRKEVYDIDLFLQFDKKYVGQDISKITDRILKNFKKTKLKGSRNYYRVRGGKNFFFEIVPVIKINNPEKAENITDLSHLHVSYVKKKIKSEKILRDIKIAKAFCQANNVYGAESYIRGFSGYSLELLVYHSGGFEKFVKIMSKIKPVEVIDIEKSHKNKSRVLMDINSAKLESPIVLVDPTHKHRNVLAALSHETFEKFQSICKKFLRNPSIKFFEKQIIDINKIKSDAKKKKYEFIEMEIKTKKQEGDIAATKMLKFYNHLSEEISIYFDIKNSGFSYGGKKESRAFFVVKSKKEVIRNGPKIDDKKNVSKFKKAHKTTFTKGSRVYSKRKIDFSLRQFLTRWKKSNTKKLKQMYIRDFEVF